MILANFIVFCFNDDFGLERLDESSVLLDLLKIPSEGAQVIHCPRTCRKHQCGGEDCRSCLHAPMLHTWLLFAVKQRFIS